MTAPTDRAIDVRALAEQAGIHRDQPTGDWIADRGDLTRFARLVLNEAAKDLEAEAERLRSLFIQLKPGEPALDWSEFARAYADRVRRLAPEEGKP